MVEGGWKSDFGELPNIDVNIVDGNSLIGLPEKTSGQSMLQAFDINLNRIQEVRDQYKSGEITRHELSKSIENLKPELTQHYLDRLSHYFEEPINSIKRWESTIDGLNNIYPTIQKITIRREDTESFSPEQKSRLKKQGFSIEPRFEKSAKS